jgi:hypothetical protein
MSGGVTTAPIAATRSPTDQVHSSRLKTRELQDAARVRTSPGPANIASSAAVYPECTIVKRHSAIVSIAATVRTIHLVRPERVMMNW